MKITYILIFFVILPIIVFVYWSLIPRRWRSLFLLTISLLFIASISIKYTCYFLLNTILVYIGGIVISREEKSKCLILKLMLFWLIGNLSFFKYINLLLNTIFKFGFQFFLLPKIHLPKILLPLGISYIIFRLIHYIVEVYRKNVPESSLVDFALYVLFFPTFLAGPVERFQRFHPQTVEQKNMDIANINYGLFRIICGLIKKFIIADNLARFLLPVLNSPQNYTRTIVIFCVYGLAIRFYMDFSGYTDMAIGVGRLFGYKIVENFNKPFFQKNIILFWRNWHISVYSWIRDYFFFPLFGSHTSIFKLYLGMFLTMVVFQLWHEGSLNFLILGCYYGSGLVIWYLFQDIKRKYPLIRNLNLKRYLDPISTFFTFNFFSISFIFIFTDVHKAFDIIRYIFM